MSGAEVHALESVACPGAGACGGQFTANTMSMALDFLGISPAGLNGIPALHPSKNEAAYEAGVLAMRARARGRPALRTSSRARRSTTPPPRSRPAAARRTASSTCSRSPASSASRHARRLRRDRRADAGDREPEARRAASSRPTCTRAGGVALVARELLKRDDLLTRTTPNVDGRYARPDRGRRSRRRPGQEVVVAARDAAEGDRRPRASSTATSRRRARS